MSDNISADKQRYLEKLAKLKALAECQTGNPNEAAAAAARMARLMFEHQITQAELEGATYGEVSRAEVITMRFFNEPLTKKTPVWHMTLLAEVATHHSCVSYTYHVPNDTGVVSYQNIVGTRQDISNTREVYIYLVVALTKMVYLQKNSEGLRLNARERDDFWRGAIVGVAKVLEAERAAQLKDIQTLQWGLQLYNQKEKDVQDKVGSLKLRKRAVQLPYVRSADIYNEGVEAGKKVTLPKKSMPRAQAQLPSKGR